jgi:hypothetical protein
MQIWVITVDLGLSVSCFVCGLAVAWSAWFPLLNPTADSGDTRRY